LPQELTGRPKLIGRRRSTRRACRVRADGDRPVSRPVASSAED
jgi:hypothetical protein